MLIRAFLRKDWAQETSYRLNFLWHFGSLVFFTLLLFFLSVAVPGFDGGFRSGGYFGFAILGFALADAMWACLKSFSNAIRHDQVVGTLEAMMATATPLPRILVAAGGYPLLYAAARLALLLAAAALMDAGFGVWELVAALPVILLSLAVFAALGVISAAMILIFKKGDPVAAIVGAVSFLLGGTLYPVSALPEGLEQLSRLVPLTWSIEATRAILLDGRSVVDLLPEMGVLVLFLLFFLAAAAVTVRGAVRVVRTHGIRQY